MSRYRVTWLEREGERVCRLTDGETEAEADVLTAFGLNVIRFAIGGRELILSPPSLAELRETPFRYGIPILGPPGRTSFGRFLHRGEEYRLPAAAGGHNMHGELGTVPWRATAYGADEREGAFLTAEFDYRGDPDRFARYPSELSLRLTYRLRNGELSLQGEARNDGDRHAPFALGFHPYFRIPGTREDVTIRIPARGEWPIGPPGTAAGLPAPTARSAALSAAAGLAAADLPTRLHYLQCSDGGETPYRCELRDRQAGHRLTYDTDGLFNVMVLFLPPWAEALSLEPHTCIPDAWNLPWDASATGARELAPGANQIFGWRIAYLRDGPLSAGGEQE